MTETAKSAFRAIGGILIFIGIMFLFLQHSVAEDALEAQREADSEYEYEQVEMALLWADIVDESAWPCITLGSVFVLATCMVPTVKREDNEETAPPAPVAQPIPAPRTVKPTVQYCEQCGAVWSEGAQYCERCGKQR